MREFYLNDASLMEDIKSALTRLGEMRRIKRDADLHTMGELAVILRADYYTDDYLRFGDVVVHMCPDYPIGLPTIEAPSFEGVPNDAAEHIKNLERARRAATRLTTALGFTE